MMSPDMQLNCDVPRLPRESASGKKDIGDRFLERSLAERYRDRFRTGRRQNTHLREVAALTQLLGALGSVKTILDMACGPGRFAYLLKSHADTLIQMDISEHMLHLSREDYPFPSNGGCYVQGDANCLPLPDNSVDLVFCHRLINHVPDAQARLRMLKELARVSRRYVVISCLGVPRIFNLLRHLNERLRGKRSVKDHVTVDEFLRSTSEAGLTLFSKTPIRRAVGTADFFTFTHSG